MRGDRGELLELLVRALELRARRCSAPRWSFELLVRVLDPLGVPHRAARNAARHRRRARRTRRPATEPSGWSGDARKENIVRDGLRPRASPSLRPARTRSGGRFRTSPVPLRSGAGLRTWSEGSAASSRRGDDPADRVGDVGFEPSRRLRLVEIAAEEAVQNARVDGRDTYSGGFRPRRRSPSR